MMSRVEKELLWEENTEGHNNPQLRVSSLTGEEMPEQNSRSDFQSGSPHLILSSSLPDAHFPQLSLAQLLHNQTVPQKLTSLDCSKTVVLLEQCYFRRPQRNKNPQG